MWSEYVVVALLVVWFLATVIYQFFIPQLAPWTARFDRFRLIPAWRFFPQNPRDFVTEVRYRSEDGELSAWRQMTGSPSKKLITAVWNPEFLEPDVVATLAEQLIGLQTRQGAARNTARSFSCRALLHGLRSFAPEHATGGEFRIVESLPDNPESQLLYSSEFHDFGLPKRIAIRHPATIRQPSNPISHSSNSKSV